MDIRKVLNSVNDCVNTGRVDLINDSIRDYVKSHCFHPKRLLVTDSLTGKLREIEAPCGFCPHCADLRTAEWVTRMYAHLDDFPFVYFVTLTYRSFTKKQIESSYYPYALVMDYLKDALWHYDDLNHNHHLAFNPCCLVKSHYQNFLKRLRKNTNNNSITFYLSGEYGAAWARPHYHLILFSKLPISRDDIDRAWSLSFVRIKTAEGFVCRRKRHDNGTCLRVSLGRIDYNNLVDNGTITNEKVQIDSSYYSASQCFAYVCKYLTKKEFNNNRVKLAFNALRDFTNSIKSNILKSYLDYGVSTPLFVNSCDCIKIDEFGNLYDVYPQSMQSFMSSFRPFKECSRGTPIGSLYVIKNLSSMASDTYPTPPLQSTYVVIPAYFRRKVKDYFYGLQRRSSLASSPSFSSGNIANFILSLDTLDNDRIAVNFGADTCIYSTVHELLNSPFVFRDKFTGFRYIICYSVLSTPYVLAFKYDRSKRSYIRVKDMSINEFTEYWSNRYFIALRKHRFYLSQIAENEKIRLDVDKTLNLVGLDLDFVRKDLVLELERDIADSYNKNKLKYLKHDSL